jgi:hypothetical protein
MTTIFSPFRHVGYFFIFNSFDEGIYQVVWSDIFLSSDAHYQQII